MRTRRSSVLLLAVLFLLLPGQALADGPWAVGPGLALGVRTRHSGVGAQGRIEITHRFSDRFTGELGAAGGVFSRAFDAVVGLDLGVRWTPLGRPTATVEPVVWGALVHAHEVPLGEWVDAPVGSTLGTCECIRHRTGLGLGIGVLVRPTQRWPLEAALRLSAIALLPRENDRAQVDNVYLGPTASIAWRF